MVATLQRLVAALAIAIVASAMAHAASPAEPEGMRQLVPIARVMAARGTGIGRAVRIRGVVTWRRGNGMIVQDDSSAQAMQKKLRWTQSLYQRRQLRKSPSDELRI